MIMTFCRGAELVCVSVSVVIGVKLFLMQAVQAYYRGEVYEAKRKNSLSKRCTISSIVIGVTVVILYLILLFEKYSIL